ncbi:hypothetical protein SDC9_134153 [bioreactor metagenome]|uniref:Uncharacterized protein n=1 Tax=bioreactor metagenome TaxID=1076179 RepID=A0A645DC48_9ZZZZ
MPHSHEGKKNPNPEPTKIDKNLFLGSQRRTRSGVKKTCNAPEMMQPNKTNGNASITMDKKIVLICKTELGIQENILSLLLIQRHLPK